MQTRGEVASERIARREEGGGDGEDGDRRDDDEPEATPTVTCKTFPDEWRGHGGPDYVTRTFTLRASGHAT